MRNWEPTALNSTTSNDEKETEREDDKIDQSRSFCKIFLGYTSNMISSGNRDIIRWLVQHRHVQVIVTTAGGIEEDLIKCMRPLVIGDFRLKGSVLRAQGINRIGNLLMPNENYCAFEDWLVPILDAMVREQNEQDTIWSPSRMIERLGREIDNEESIYYWAARNNIPVFCPAITDGSIGDMIYFHSYKATDERDRLKLDLVTDIRLLNNEAIRAGATGIICLGGGLVKHHICNANLMRNGAEFGVFINTGLEYDGSDSGASPDEAVSWGKIKSTAQPVKVFCDATIAFPLLVAETFAKQPSASCRKHDAAFDHLYL
jgi:deoxyhypusine synthase